MNQRLIFAPYAFFLIPLLASAHGVHQSDVGRTFSHSQSSWLWAAGVAPVEPHSASGRIVLGEAGNRHAVIDQARGGRSTELWSSDMESGLLDEWERSSLQKTPCGGAFSSGFGRSEPSEDVARSGRWSVKMTIPGMSAEPAVSGARMHRWCESQRNDELYYSVWYYVPQTYMVEPQGWLNLFQFKSKIGSKSDPFFFLDVRNTSATGEMRFLLTWWAGLQVDGPHSGQRGYRVWLSPQPIPVGRWFKVEARYVCAGDFGGAIQVWQDDAEIFRLEGVRTRYPDGDCQWGVNNYGVGVLPSPVVIYIDDAAIAISREER